MLTTTNHTHKDKTITMIMYEANNGFNEIKPIEVERANGTSYWVKGRRSARLNSYTSVWYTFEEARDYLKQRLERKIGNAQRDLDRCQNEIKKLNQLPTPSPKTTPPPTAEPPTQKELR
jgi:hypothetical protein